MTNYNNIENTDLHEKYQYRLRSRLQLTLEMLILLYQEKLSVSPNMQHFQNETSKIQELLKQNTQLTTEELENLLEHCKLYFNKYL